MLAQLARDLGKSLEPKLWASWGGKPTTRLLRHRDQTIAEPTKCRYFKTLAAAGIARPSVEAEAADPHAADLLYESAGDWLKRQARSTASTTLVGTKLASYGFARNLLGVRWMGFASTTAVAMAESAYAAHLFLTGNEVAPEIMAAAVLAACLALLWLFHVREDRVRSAADAYAFALLECSEPKVPSPRVSKPRSPTTPSGTLKRTSNRKKATSPTVSSPSVAGE